MTALTQPCYTPAAALEREPSEASSQVMVTSGIVLFGTAMRVVVAVISPAMVAATHLQWASVKCAAEAIFKVVVTRHSSVTGVLVMEP